MLYPNHVVHGPVLSVGLGWKEVCQHSARARNERLPSIELFCDHTPLILTVPLFFGLYSFDFAFFSFSSSWTRLSSSFLASSGVSLNHGPTLRVLLNATLTSFS